MSNTFFQGGGIFPPAPPSYIPVLMSVVPVTFGSIWPWFSMAWKQFLYGPALGHGPIFADPWFSSIVRYII